MDQQPPGGVSATTGPPIVSKHVFSVLLWVFFGLATIALTFRFYVRFRCFRKLLADDYIAGFAWLLLLISACIWYMTIDNMYELSYVSAGMALPDANFPHNAHRFLVGSNVALVMFYVGLWSIKLSFLVFFYRLGENFRSYQICWWVILVFTVSSGLVCIGDIQYHCLSDSFEEVFSKCVSDEAIRFQEITVKLNCALDVVTDAMIMALPISVVWNIRVGLGRKILLGAIFSLVVITMTFAVVRVTVVSEGYTTTQQGGQQQAEITWLYFWSFIEFAVAVIVVSLASFRTLFVRKTRESEAEEAHKREMLQREAPSSKSKAVWARAKYFQQSLLETIKSESEVTNRQATTDSNFRIQSVSLAEHGLLEDSHSMQKSMRSAE